MIGATWLWPDRAIGKRESRTLREEHNATVNALADTVEALADAHETLARGPGHSAIAYCPCTVASAYRRAKRRGGLTRDR